MNDAEFVGVSSPQYSSFIHLSRYSRWLPDQGRRETWSETVQRYVDFFKNKFPNLQEDIQSLYSPIYNLEVLPSMRCLMTAGKALERDNIAGYNPLSLNTVVVTKEYGNVPLSFLVEKKEATVLNVNGVWAPAVFKEYGDQSIYKITFKLNSNTVKEVEATENHRWILEGGTILATSSLRAGDRIKFVNSEKPKIDDDYILGVRHGIVYGDGTATKSSKRVKGYHVRLCGQSAELLTYFDGYPVCYPPSAGGDPIVMLYDEFAATHALKELPLSTETDSYLLGFIRGWMAADGSITKTSQISLCCADVGKAWLIQNSERLGFVIQRCYRQSDNTNYGKRKQPSNTVNFSRSSCTAEDFLCSWKKSKFRELESHWVVSSVEDIKQVKAVACAEVPDTNTFTLAGGLITGNCAFITIDHLRSFDEILFILMNGTGVGFSVERQYISKLPELPDQLYDTDTTIIVADSKIGWASSYRQLLSLLFSGLIPKWDLSKLRPAGAKLKTFGGRSSGPQPLEDLFKFTIQLCKKAVGRKLNSIECHDLVCMIAKIVVVGGVRRSALISLSNLSDDRMRLAKSGQWWIDNQQRELANNSASYAEKPEFEIFLKEWQSLYESKSGERGLFNNQAAKRQALRTGRRNPDLIVGTNPCAEILLRSAQFCNLSTIIVRKDDTVADLTRKVELATILGTLQSSLTDFRYIRSLWKKNTEEERLLGVSMTGIMDHPILGNCEDETLPNILVSLKEKAIEVNKYWANKIGVSPSTSITTVKPEGTVSQLTDTASGIHPRFSPFYIRRVRADRRDPLAMMMHQQGFPCEEVKNNPNVLVFSFPVKAPDSSKVVEDVGAMQQLKLWTLYQEYWCEHKPSMTVYYKDSEFLEVGNWVWNNFDNISGISFLPYMDHVYQQAPYEKITKEQYNELCANMPINVDWSILKNFEEDDNTKGSQTYACTGNVCEVVDLV